MNFDSYKEAREYAKLETILTKKQHKAVKTRYFDVAKWEYVPCWTVILVV